MMQFKNIRFILAVIVGALLWAGCVAEPKTGLQRIPTNQPYDWTQWHADTHPELRFGMNPL